MFDKFYLDLIKKIVEYFVWFHFAAYFFKPTLSFFGQMAAKTSTKFFTFKKNRMSVKNLFNGKVSDLFAKARPVVSNEAKTRVINYLSEKVRGDTFI